MALSNEAILDKIEDMEKARIERAQAYEREKIDRQVYINSRLDAIYEQVVKTNGRVNTHETEIKKLTNQSFFQKGALWVIVGLFLFITTLLTIFVTWSPRQNGTQVNVIGDSPNSKK